MKSDAASEPEPGLDLEDLFETLEAPLLRFAYKLVMNADSAQDIVQEAFTRLVHKQAGVTKPRAWLYATAHNLAMSHLRTQQKVVSMQNVVGGDEMPDPKSQSLPLDELERKERISQIHIGLSQLAHRDRTLIQLKYHQNLSYKDIAQRMGMTVSNVGYCMHHALKSLEMELRQEGATS